MLFSNKKCSKPIVIRINEHPIDQVYSTKFLGVIVDCDLNWKEHIKRVNSKIAKSVAVMYNLREMLPVNSLKLLYNSLVFPYIDYCLEVWGNTYHTNLNSVFIMQKKAMRNVYKVQCRHQCVF